MHIRAYVTHSRMHRCERSRSTIPFVLFAISAFHAEYIHIYRYCIMAAGGAPVAYHRGRVAKEIGRPRVSREANDPTRSVTTWLLLDWTATVSQPRGRSEAGRPSLAKINYNTDGLINDRINISFRSSVSWIIQPASCFDTPHGTFTSSNSMGYYCN